MVGYSFRIQVASGEEFNGTVTNVIKRVPLKSAESFSSQQDEVCGPK